jgi:hypothetical protein
MSRLAIGKVVDGKIEVHGEQLEDGTEVTVVLPGDDAIELSADEASEVREGLAELERGDWLAGDQLLADLRRS